MINAHILYEYKFHHIPELVLPYFKSLDDNNLKKV